MSREVLSLNVQSFVRDGHRILEDVAFSVARGEHWAVLGANGSGKSTLLRILAAYEWPTEGAVRVLGESYGRCDMNAVKRRIGIVSESLESVLPRRETAVEVAASGLYALIGHWREYDADDRAAALAALARVSAAGFADKPFGLLSQGQKQRVVIARALVRRPELLVLDEPCDGLDPVARERFLRDVDALLAAEQAPTLLYVTHHLEELPRSITHALVLREGRVVARGPVAEVLVDDVMRRAFDAPCVVERRDGRFRLVVDLRAEEGKE